MKQVECSVSVPRRSEGFDFRDQKIAHAYMERERPDIVINCAAIYGGIGYHVGRQADLFLDNMLMGSFLMQAAQKNGVKKFVNVVACCAYPGYLDKEVLTENDFWNGKLHESVFSYGLARKASVGYGMALKEQFNFNSIHLIVANMYGPGEHFEFEQSKVTGALIRKFYEAKRDNSPRVSVWGSGKAIRDFLYVRDGAEGILRAGAVYDAIEPLNIATGVGVSIKELAEIIRDTVDYRGEIFYDTTKPDGHLRRVFSTELMKQKLNWVPQTPLAKGIEETVAWFAQHYEEAIKY